MAEVETPQLEVVEIPDVEEALASTEPLPDSLPILPLRETVTYPDTLTPLAVGQERSIKLVNEVLSGNRMLAMVASKDPELDTPGPGRPLRRRRRRHRRADDEGPRRHPAHPGPGERADPDRRLRQRAALSGREDRGDARRGGGIHRARGPDPQRAEHLQPDHRGDPLPAGGAAARRRQPRRALRALPSDLRRASHLHRGEAGAARDGRRDQAAAPPLGDPHPRARGRPARLEDPVAGRVRDRQGPARVLPAPADEGDPGGAGGGGRAAGGAQRAAPAHRGGGAARGGAEVGRARALPPGEAAAGRRRVRRDPHLPRVAGRPALVEGDRGQPRHRPRQGGARRGPLRPRGGQGPDPRVPRRAQAQPGLAGADPLLRRPARRRQDQPRPLDRQGARARVRADLGRRRASTRPRSAAIAAPTSARFRGRSSERSATPAPGTPSS